VTAQSVLPSWPARPCGLDPLHNLPLYL
jgi:hypothetical protein